LLNIVEMAEFMRLTDRTVEPDLALVKVAA
jgi:hypothetical protein